MFKRIQNNASSSWLRWFPLTASFLAIFATTAAVADLYDDVEDIEKPKAPVTGPLKPSSTPVPSRLPAGTSQRPVQTNQPDKATPKPQTSPDAVPGPSTPRTGPTDEKREPVYFESMGLQGQRSQGVINLLDKVVVTQGDMRMEADKANVHFDQKTEEVNKIVAIGNVKMFRTDPDTNQKVRAESNEVLFLNLERKVILKGNAKLWRGGDLVKGKRFAVDPSAMTLSLYRPFTPQWLYYNRTEGNIDSAFQSTFGDGIVYRDEIALRETADFLLDAGRANEVLALIAASTRADVFNHRSLHGKVARRGIQALSTLGVLLPQKLLVELADAGFRQHVDKQDLFRNTELGDDPLVCVAFHMGPDLVRADLARGIRLEHDECHWPLAPFRVLDTDHRHLAHGAVV